jgi:hypothetical protein
VSRLAARLICAGVTTLVLAVLAVQISPVMNPPKWDEFIVVYDAHRITAGQVPYRDFFNFIPPGVFLVLAAPLKAAGASSLTVGRYVSSFGMIALFGLAAWALRRRGWSGATSCLWAAVVPVALFGFWAVPSHHWMAAACAAGLTATLARPREAGAMAAFGAGLCTGLAGLFTQTAGLLLAACSLVLLVQVSRRPGTALAAWVAGVGAIWGPVLTGLALLGGGGAFVRDVILWPVRNYSREGNENAGAALQDLPWRVGDLWGVLGGTHLTVGHVVVSVVGLVLYGALILGLLTLMALATAQFVRILRRRSLGEPWLGAAVLATFLMLGLTAKGSANWLHVVFAAALLAPLWLTALGEWGLWTRAARVGAAVLLGVLLGAGALYHARGLWFHAPEAWEFTDVDRPIREQSVNRWLRSPGVLEPGDTIAAFPEGGEVYLYSAPAAVGYTYFLPLNRGYNSLEDHTVVARQIEQRRPKFILVPPDMERDYLDQDSPVSGVLASWYERKQVIGNAVLYQLENVGVAPPPRGRAEP